MKSYHEPTPPPPCNWVGDQRSAGGIAQEELTDDRLRFGVPHLLVLKPVEATSSP